MQILKFIIITVISFLIFADFSWKPNLSTSFTTPKLLAQSTNNRKAEADKLLKEGIKKIKEGLRRKQTDEIKAAEKSFQQSLMIYRDINNRQGEAISLNLLGNIYYIKSVYFNQGQLSSALNYFQQAQNIFKQLNLSCGEASSSLNSGIVYGILDQPEKARQSLQNALTIYQSLKELHGQAIAQVSLGGAYGSLGQYKQAIDSFQQARNQFRKFNDNLGEAISLIGLNIAYSSSNQPQKSIEAFEQLQEVLKKLNQNSREVIDLDNLNRAPFLLTQYDLAIKCFNSVRNHRTKQIINQSSDLKNYYRTKQFRDTQDTSYNNILSGQAEYLNAQANQYSFIGQYSKAIELYQQALKIFRDIKNPYYEALTLNNLGFAYLGKGQLEQVGESDNRANESYKQASQSFELAKNILQKLSAPDEVVSWQGLGIVTFSQGNTSRGIEFLQKSLSLQSQFNLNNPSIKASSLANLGIAYLFEKQYPKAIDSLKQSLEINRNIKEPFGEASISGILGLAFFQSGDLAAAENTLKDAIKVRESLRSGLSDANKVAIFEVNADVYRTLEQVLIAKNKPEEALEIAEQGRARAFVELLAKRLNPSDTIETSIKPPVLKQIKQIAQQENATLVEYAIAYDLVLNKDKGLQRQASKLLIWVIKPTGEITFLRTDIKPFLQQPNISLRHKVAQARESIVKGVNVRKRGNNIALMPGDRVRLKDDDPNWEAWQVVDVKNSTITIRLPSWEVKQASIKRPITDVIEKVTNNPGANVKNPELQELYQLLIQPITDLLPKQETARVIFIPQDALFLVPFPALQDSAGQYLIDKHTILTSPSIQVLDSTHKLRQKVPGSAKDVLVVGNPTMPKVSKIPGQQPQQLNPLPGSEKEALMIASFWKTQAFIGNQATKKAVLQKIPLTRIIHLATHGLLDDIQGLGSSIVFAPEGEDNGLLTAEDILNLYTPPQGSALSAELVVLSACDTGQGRLTGDGVIGLSRSIIAAGVPSVIVSLWSIPDAPTAELMTEFYENFRKNPDKATALREAMLTTKKKHPNPADWGAFTLIGESE